MTAKTITLDTNLIDNEQLAQAARVAGFEFVHTTVTDRELAGSGVNPVTGRKAHVFETIILGESAVGIGALGSDADAVCFETLLKVISNGAFPAAGERGNLTAGQRRQLRDAVIFCAHVREKRQIFVTNDKKAFIDGGRRELLETVFNTKILAAEEFLLFCDATNSAYKNNTER